MVTRVLCVLNKYYLLQTVSITCSVDQDFVKYFVEARDVRYVPQHHPLILVDPHLLRDRLNAPNVGVGPDISKGQLITPL